MEALKQVLPSALVGQQSRSELAVKLDRFTFERVLSQGTTSPYIYLLGSIDGESAIVHLQKIAFDIPDESSNLAPLVSTLEQVKTLEKNDIYEWAQGWYGLARAADVKVNIIHPCTATHIKKYSAQKRFMVNETPEVYKTVVKPYIDSFPASRIQWVYNILEHRKEVDKIAFEDEDPETGFVILPDMKWDGKTLSALYLTAIVHNRRLKSIRDLQKTDLPLLRKIKNAGESLVTEKYGVKRGAVRLFLHYQPSYYHLHVHIVSLANEGFAGAEVGKAHLLDDVISLLEQSKNDSETLLQRMTLTYQLGQEDELYKALKAAGSLFQDQDAIDGGTLNSTTMNERSMDAWMADADLPICTACGTQYPASRDVCPICEDDRQFVPVSGQSWSSLQKLADSGHTNELVKDVQDQRISLIKTVPSFGIGQTPFLLETAQGSFVWDCCAFLSQALVKHLSELKNPLRGVVISHPHFYTTSLTWAKVLSVPLFICAKDKDWYQREADLSQAEVTWFDEDLELTSNLKVIRCGGHFTGSSILYWDRSTEPNQAENHTVTRQDGIIFCADTAMVQPTQKGFTFQYSVPNMIPLNPYDVAYLYKKLKDLSYGQATSTWPGRFVREEASQILAQSVRKHLEAMGCDWLWSSLQEGVADHRAGPMTWNSSDLLSSEDKPQHPKQSLIILNQPITRRDIFDKLWTNCAFRICADGGANRLFDILNAQEREQYLPDMIKGDLDSLRDDVRAFYETKGTAVARDESEYTTDLQKCIEEIDERAGEEASATIVILGGLSGRLDQTTHVLALLQKLRRGNGSNNHRDTEASTSAWQGSDFKVFMGQELVSNSRGEDLYQDFAKGNGTKDIRVISENCVAWVLDVGEHTISIDHETYGPTCGILPIGIESSHVETKGLRWDFDWQTSFSTQISTSNHLDPENRQVSVRTSRPVWWTMEIKDLDSTISSVQQKDALRIPLPYLREPSFAFLTTMRYTHPQGGPGIIPLLALHLDRMCEAANCRSRENISQDVTLPAALRERLSQEIAQCLATLPVGDYRLRCVMSTTLALQLQAIPLPTSSPPFKYSPEDQDLAVYDVMLDPLTISSDDTDKALYMVKTTARQNYEIPLARTKQAARTADAALPFDTILHWRNPESGSSLDDLISETSFANIAVFLPINGHAAKWLTPEENEASPFLPGVMRRHLLERGILRTGRITVSDLRKWVKENRRVIGMNGLRGVWEARVVFLPDTA